MRRLLPALAAAFAEIALPSLALATDGPPAAGEPAPARPKAAVEWFALPIVYYQPETHLGYGALGGVHFRTEPGLQTSDAQLIVSGTTRQQAFLRLDSHVFPTERLALGGTLRLFDYPDFFWGVGGDAPSSAKEAFTSRYVEALLTLEWYVVPRRLRTGPRAWFRQEALRDLQPGGQLASGTLPGSEGYAAPAVGWGLSWDSRDTRFFPRSGSSVEAWYLYAARSKGSALRSTRAA